MRFIPQSARLTVAPLVPLIAFQCTPSCAPGPSDKTLTYDASPLAQPLLGSGVIDFGVPVYSKAASLMAMLSTYAAEAGADDADGGGAADSNGPIQDLMGSTPPNTLQVCTTTGGWEQQTAHNACE